MSKEHSKAKKKRRVVNIGVIGCGCISENHLFSLTLIENNARRIWEVDTGKARIRPKLYALADIDGKPLEEKGEAFGVKNLYGGENAGYDLISDPKVDAVFVLVPTVDHLDLVLKAAEAGKHVFCEKPLAFSPEDVQKMIEAREKNSVVIQAGLVFRSAPQINYLKHLVEERGQKWGKPTNIIFRDSQEKPYTGLDEHASTWRQYKDKAHAGILFEHTIHDIDGMIMVFGEISSVFARVDYFAEKEGIEDSVSAILTFKNGLKLSVNSMWNDIDYSRRRMEIFFEKSYVMVTVDEREEKSVAVRFKHLWNKEMQLEDNVMDHYFRKNILGKPHIKPQIPGPYYYEDLRFIDCIVKGKSAEVSLEMGKYVQKVIEACYESSRTGKVVNIS